MTIVYELHFGKKARYIGIADNLNDRLAQHARYWKTEGLVLTRVKLLFHGTRKKCAAIEKGLIADDATGTLLNKDYTGLLFKAREDKLYEDIDTPMEILDSRYTGVARQKHIKKKITTLENRYISLYLDLQRAKANMNAIDEIVEEAVRATFN